MHRLHLIEKINKLSIILPRKLIYEICFTLPILRKTEYNFQKRHFLTHYRINALYMINVQFQFVQIMSINIYN